MGASVICVVPEPSAALKVLIATPEVSAGEGGDWALYAPAPPPQKLWSHPLPQLGTVLRNYGNCFFPL